MKDFEMGGDIHQLWDAKCPYCDESLHYKAGFDSAGPPDHIVWLATCPAGCPGKYELIPVSARLSGDFV